MEIFKINLTDLESIIIEIKSEKIEAIIFCQVMRKEQRMVLLDVSYDLVQGQGYADKILPEIKEDLEGNYGSKLTKSQNQQGARIYCQTSGCRFHANFELEVQDMIWKPPGQKLKELERLKKEEKKQDPQNLKKWAKGTLLGKMRPFQLEKDGSITFQRKVYYLRSFDMMHLEECIDNDEAIFLKKKRELTILSSYLKEIIYKKIEEGQEIENPKELLLILEKQTGMPHDYIYQGLERQDHRRKIKKRYDNIISEIKNNIPPEIEVLNNNGKFLNKNSCHAEENERVWSGMKDQENESMKQREKGLKKSAFTPQTNPSSTEKSSLEKKIKVQSFESTSNFELP